jgi:gamma-glutamylcyclotransferase (GGCT)/AIG2-like uncharacterized protein YtfP
MPLLFSYGTLQQESVQLSTFGRSLRGEADALPCFESAIISARDAVTRRPASRSGTYHMNVIYNGRDDSRVGGTVFEITDDELAAADRYERRAAYVRIEATLASGRRAWVYAHDPEGRP